jgi:hypothetical protein
VSSRHHAKIFLAGFLATLTLMVPLYAAWSALRFTPSGAWHGASDFQQLKASKLPVAHVVEAIDRLIKPGECVLLFRQADYAYYGKNCYISYLDKRLIPLYQATDSMAVLKILQRHRIRLIFLPDYGTPEVYNTELESFLANPAYASIVWDLDQNRLFAVHDTPLASRGQRELLRFGEEWRLRDARGGLTNRIAITDVTWRRNYLTTGVALPSSMPVEGWKWDAGAPCDRLAQEPALRGFEVEVEGRGYVIMEALESGAAVRMDSLRRIPQMLWNGAINGRRKLKGQYVVEPGQCLIPRLKFHLLGNGKLRVISGRVFEHEISPDGNLDFSRHRAELAGWTARTKHYFSRGWQWGMAVDGTVWTESHPDFTVVTRLDSPVLFMGDIRGTYPAATLVDISIAITGRGLANIQVERLVTVPQGLIASFLRNVRHILDNLDIDAAFFPRLYGVPGPYFPELMVASTHTLARLMLSEQEKHVAGTLRVEEADALRVVVQLPPHLEASSPDQEVHVRQLVVGLSDKRLTRDLYRLRQP